MNQKRENKPLENIRRRLQRNDLLYLMTELGIATLAVTVPYIATVAFLIKVVQEKDKRLTAIKIRNSFYSLKRRGLLAVESRHGQAVISLTPEAQHLIRYRQLQSAFVQKRKERWNGRWCVVMFDIANQKTAARNALRTLLRKFGFAYLQKSVWVYPYDCRTELEFLKSFFHLSDSELRVLICDTIGDDQKIRAHFRI